ncbi:MAG TPA: hypothetical protein VIK86_09080 [Candidatus Paceibacterota bacterium]
MKTKAVRCYTTSDDKRFNLYLHVDKKLLAKKISDFLGQVMVYCFFLCGFTAFLMVGYCISKMSMSFSQFYLIFTLGAIGSVPFIFLHWEKVKEFLTVAKEKTKAIIMKIFA